MGIVSRRMGVMDGKVNDHAFGNKLLMAKLPDKDAYWSGGISLGMVSTHRLASWEFHCFSTASAAFHKVLRSAYSCGALGGSRISFWTILRSFSGCCCACWSYSQNNFFAALVSSGGSL